MRPIPFCRGTMSDDLAISQYDASPDDALAAIRTYEKPLIVDLDETLYLRNSTEDLIDCAWPGPLALLLPRVLEMVKPWRLTGGHRYRGHLADMRHFELLSLDSLALARKGSILLLKIMSIENLRQR
jgi:hypothetical protein